TERVVTLQSIKTMHLVLISLFTPLENTTISWAAIITIPNSVLDTGHCMMKCPATNFGCGHCPVMVAYGKIFSQILMASTWSFKLVACLINILHHLLLRVFLLRFHFHQASLIAGLRYGFL